MADYYLGIMTGTSLDGIDVALICHEDAQDFRYLTHYEHPMPEAVRAQLYALYQRGENELQRAAQSAWQLSQACAQAVHILLQRCQKTAAEIRAIGSHGQTLRHCPNAQPPYTIQIQNPALLAELTGIDVIADFRSRDLACDGQGAPLAPLFHRALCATRPINIVNIGGIANLSVITAEQCFGFDTGTGNALMDAWIQRHQHKNYDRGAAWAKSGQLHHELLRHFLRDPFFSAPPPKSSGRDYFDLAWLDRHLAAFPSLTAEDVQHTLCALTATTIAQAVHQYGQGKKILLVGGGARNPLLVTLLRQALPEFEFQKSSIPPQALEASGFAWLAAQFCQRHPLDLNTITGGQCRILGALYPH